MTRRDYVTVNSCIMCQPMGSVLAFKGIENTMVLFHGSQGCSTYMRLHLAHHFREPVDIASSSLSEKGAVYGGRENLKKGLRNVINRYNPKIIGVATTCLAETIGDDVPAIIREFKEEEGIGDSLEKDILIIPVSTPSYGESHVTGYIKAVDAIIKAVDAAVRKTREEQEGSEIQEGSEKAGIFEKTENSGRTELSEALSENPGAMGFMGNIEIMEYAELLKNEKLKRNLREAKSQYTGKTVNNKLNLIPVESLSPADIRELKEILEATVGEYILLPDISETFDAPLRSDLPKIAPGGTTLAEIADMPNSLASLGLGTVSKNLAVDYLQKYHGVPSYNVPIPIGLSNTDRFFMEMARMGYSFPEKYQKERGRLLDAMVDVHKYLYGVKAGIYGDPDTVFSLTRFLLELGINPVLVATGSKSRDFKQQVQKAFAEIRSDLKAIIMDNLDFDSFYDAVKQSNPELLIGNSNGRYIAKAQGIPLVRVGLPVHDRIGAQRLLMVGYRGAMELLDRITNTVLEATDTFTAPVQPDPEVICRS